ncbi:alpha/beta hydrolase [Verrucomicrobiaceae bacterium R5-34]|nr:alpha/beta hydrolase [Verrucomicrobiaceae bacterium R5-34]
MSRAATPILAAVLSCLLLCHCSDFAVKRLSDPVRVVSKNLPEPDGNRSQVYHRAYQLVKQAQSMESSAPAAALGRYLEAAEMLTEAGDDQLLPLTNFATGQAAELLVSQPDLRVGHGRERRYRVEIPRVTRADSLRGKVGLSEFTKVVAAETLALKGWKHRVMRGGVGAAMVAHYQPAKTGRAVEDQFLHESGIFLPVTVVVDFPRRGVARFQTHDSTVESRVRVNGRQRLLSADLTAPIALSLEKARSRGLLEDLRGVFYPVRYVKNLGLYSVQKFDRRKTPLILVHGLASDPSTWSTTLNGLFTDADVLANYQIYFFYYPTGFPIRRTGSALKKELLELQGFYHKMGITPDQAVIVGHSMGGLLTSMQVRNFGPKTWRKIATIPLQKAQLAEQVKKDYRTLMQLPRPTMIDRAVFIATPHRGSQMANDWIGRVVISLIKIPQQALTLDPVKASRSLTELGRTILLNDDMTNGVQALKHNNPALKLVASTPVADAVSYHSIIGDRGLGDSPHSSDGVVAYRSAHLQGAQSEVIVPAGHSAHTHPQAIRELRRILRLNLKSN